MKSNTIESVQAQQNITEYNLVILFPINGPAVYKEIKNWDIAEILDIIQCGSYYGFRFEHRQRIIEKFPKNGRLDIDIKKLKISGIYYLDCFVETLEDLIRKPRQDTALIKQMQKLGVKKAVRTIKEDLIFPYLEDDVVIDKMGNIVDF